MERRTINDMLADARAGLHRLWPAEAHAAMEDGALLIDTRCGELRRRDGSIPGSVHAPLSVLFWRLDPASGYDDAELSQGLDRRVILMCDHGFSSSLAAATLRDRASRSQPTSRVGSRRGPPLRFRHQLAVAREGADGGRHIDGKGHATILA